MAHFYRRWWERLVKPWPLVQGLPAMIRRALGLISVAGIGLGGWATVAYWKSDVPLPTWVIAFSVAVFLVAVYAALTAGIAWAETRGPSVKVSELLFDGRVGMFYVVVTSTSPGRVRPNVKLVGAFDSRGNRLLTFSHDVHWRDYPPDYSVVLDVEGANAEAGVLWIVRTDKGELFPHVWAKNDQRIRLDPKVPWDRRDRIRLEVRVTCERVSDDGNTALEQGLTIEKTYFVVSDEKENWGYVVAT